MLRQAGPRQVPWEKRAPAAMQTPALNLCYIIGINGAAARAGGAAE